MSRLILIVIAVLTFSASIVSAQSSLPTPPPLDEADCFPTRGNLAVLGDDVKVAEDQALYQRGTKARQQNHWIREDCGRFYFNMPGKQEPDDEIYMVTYLPVSWDIEDAKAIIPHFLPGNTKLTGWATTSNERKNDYYHVAKCRDDSCFVVIYESVTRSEAVGDRHFFTIRIATTYDEAARDCYRRCPTETDIP